QALIARLGATILSLNAFATGPCMNFQEPVSGLMERIAQALERLGPARPQTPAFQTADAFVFQAETERFSPVSAVNRLPLPLLKGIDRNRDILLANTERFAQGLPANN